ncbi:MAG TPA: hypothetical protein VLN49_03530 [Gemmatimonadaceae bacterium]|nr:hypothetical protein [Gemmatimonadaceae bacterium]
MLYDAEPGHVDLKALVHGFAAGAVVALLAACTGARDTTGPGDYPIRFQVTNDLVAPVTVRIDGTPVAILSSGKGTALTVSSSAQWLTWTSAKPAGADGVAIPDHIGEVKIPVSGISGSLEIRNVIADQTYVTARIFNATRAQVLIGVFDGSEVACAGVLPAATSDGTSGLVQIGYYRLVPATEVRAYRDGSRCSGPYVAWPGSTLKAYAANSGLVFLTLDAAP